MSKVIVLTLQEDGQVGITLGGEITHGEGVRACTIAGEWFREQAIRAQIAREQEEAHEQKDT